MTYDALLKAYEFCLENDIDVPLDLHMDIYETLKTEAYYSRVMWIAIRDLYNKRVSQYEFEDVMIRLIEGQLKKAWYAGMREIGLNPPEDMTDDFKAELDRIQVEELGYVPKLLNEIVTASESGAPVDQFKARVDLWVARFKDVTNQAKLYCSKDNSRFMWILGETEEHCGQCNTLNGMVATAEEWRISGVHPQNPVNPVLDCEGWRCQCRLELTSQRRSPNALDTLLNIALSAQKSVGDAPENLTGSTGL